MEFDDIRARLGSLPFMEPDDARFLYELIVGQRIGAILELGIAHGAGTCYMAAALRKAGGGRIDAVDLETPFDPSPEAVLAEHGLADLVAIHRTKTGYNWFLHDAIAAATRDGRCEPVYDLCILDGAKHWTMDSSAFFLADKLLKPGGWFIFDDYGWTYEKADNRREQTDGITHRSLSEAERRTPHVREIVELLVRQHPDYGEVRVRNDWAIARKQA